ncbi:MAG: phosphoglycerate dehydrogenase [Vagococcus sp.]
MTFTINTYNAIAKKGLALFKPNEYHINTTSQPDSILLRSHSLHTEVIPESTLMIARAGAGTNNIPVDTCTTKGIAVFNTPGANANAVKELVLASMLLMSRPILDSVQWTQTLDTHNLDCVVEQHKQQFVGTELEGKTLGVIGLGAIGSRVANDAYQIGMNVIGYDPHVSVDTAWKMSRRVNRVFDINDIWKQADFITLHIPLTPETTGFINKKELEKMKPKAVLLNFSRGNLVDNSAILTAITQKKIAHYVTDFPEPSLINRPNITVLPHLGASTKEAEINCARSAVHATTSFLETGNTQHSVNFPNIEMTFNASHRLTIFHKNIPNMIGTMTNIMSEHLVNIDNLSNRSRGEYAYTLIDLDRVTNDTCQHIIEQIDTIPGVIRTRYIINTYQ